MNKHQLEGETTWARVFGIGFVGALVVGLVALAFLWPAKVAQPHDYPVAITGSSTQQITTIKQETAQNSSDVIKFVDAASREEAIRMISEREVFGALIMNAPNPEILIASANGQTTNAVMTTMATTLQTKLNEMAASRPVLNGVSAQKPEVKTTDIIPAHNLKFDIAQLALPLVFGGIIGGTVVARIIRGRWQRLGALAVYAFFASAVLYLITQTWFGLLPNNFWTIAGAFSLGIFATSSFVAGSYALFGMRGLVAAGATTMLLANPLSGLVVPSLFLPEPWGVIGQGLTVGATGTLVRAAAYFPTSAVTTVPIMVLGIWSVLGVAAISLKKGS